jgi:ssDNA thymidine ADP-ribosyltransferase DarT-like protein
MPGIDPLKRITLLYHFTDRRNLPSIRKHGGLYPATKLAKKQIEVPAPGGNDWSRDADGMKGVDAYIHLCFRATHPMEYVARSEGRIGDTIFLQIHPDVLAWDGVMFTNDVSNKAGVEIHTIQEGRKLIDFEVLYTRTNWSDPDIQKRLQQAEKYEILVPKKIPLDLIRNLPNG